MPYSKTTDVKIEDCPEKIRKQVTIMLAKFAKMEALRILRIDEYDDNKNFTDSFPMMKSFILTATT